MMKESDKYYIILTLAVILLFVSILFNVHESNKHDSYYAVQPEFYDADTGKTSAVNNHYETGDDQQSHTDITIVESQQYETSQHFSTPVVISNQTPDDITLINMTDAEAWNLLSNGIFPDYPKSSYITIKDKVQEIKDSNTQEITVPIWYWKNPDDTTDMSKVSATATFQVNSKVADLYTHIFQDIYADASQPIINLGDSAMGTWVTRGKNHNPYATLSAHAIGAAIDINPSTATFEINGAYYGNAYGNKAMPQSIWQTLPESHKKYQVLYQDCPIVQIFKSYGFYWGGDWHSGTDPMHLAFLGDGTNAREVGQSNYNSYHKE